MNWVENLPNFIQVLKESAQEEQGWKSPFELCYRRKSNVVAKA